VFQVYGIFSCCSCDTDVNKVLSSTLPRRSRLDVLEHFQFTEDIIFFQILT